jgi:hypothetical protein
MAEPHRNRCTADAIAISVGYAARFAGRRRDRDANVAVRLRGWQVPRDDAPGMRVLQAIGLGLLFAVGAVLGVAIGVVVVPVSAWRRARAVHADGVVCRAELIARDASAERLAGPALVRLSGAFGSQTAASDVLGLDIRMQRTASDDPTTGDQDLLLGSFESFATAGRDRARTDAGDYLANTYSTVTPWWLAGRGPVILRLVPPAAAPAARGTDRLARLDADLAADRARFTLAVSTAAGPSAADAPIAELRLVARLAIDDRALRASMWRHRRGGLVPVGLRNGIRATVYPMSQLARRLRGG